MKILILGYKGWMGSALKEYLESNGHEVVTVEGDVNSLETVTLQEFDKLDAVVNFAASTNIDWCEKNKVSAFWNNVLGAMKVASITKPYPNIKHVFVSSACIFQSKDENDIKFEDSKPQPACFYAETKLMAERLINEINPDTLIVRPRLPISEKSHPRNTLDKLSTYEKLLNTQESVTVLEDFVVRLVQLIQEGAKGTYNVVNEGTISPAELGELMGHKFETFSKKDLDKKITEENKANRVSTVVGSKHGYLPPIKTRAAEVVEKWKETVKSKPSA